MEKFEKNKNGENYVLDGGDFYISYNPEPGSGINIFQADNGGDETALVNPNDADNKFRILNGDFRKEYKAAFKQGWDGCLAVYNKYKKEFNSSWTTNKVI